MFIERVGQNKQQPIYGRHIVSLLKELGRLVSLEFYKHCAATRLSRRILHEQIASPIHHLVAWECFKLTL
jgi:hypothetical protein